MILLTKKDKTMNKNAVVTINLFPICIGLTAIFAIMKIANVVSPAFSWTMVFLCGFAPMILAMAFFTAILLFMVALFAIAYIGCVFTGKRPNIRFRFTKNN
jgi:uncharacterized membrane protein